MSSSRALIGGGPQTRGGGRSEMDLWTVTRVNLGHFERNVIKAWGLSSVNTIEGTVGEFRGLVCQLWNEFREVIVCRWKS